MCPDDLSTGGSHHGPRVHRFSVQVANDSFFNDLLLLAESLFRVSTAGLCFFDVPENKVRLAGLPINDALVAMLSPMAKIHGTYLEIPDTLREPFLRGDATILSDPIVRFFGAVPLVDVDGVTFGTLCLFDRSTRRLRPDEVHALNLLGKLVIDYLESHRVV